MEEARVYFFDHLGYGLKDLKTYSVTSPIVSVEYQYKHTTTFDDEIKINVSVEEYTGVKLILNYLMTNIETGAVVLNGRSSQ